MEKLRKQLERGNTKINRSTEAAMSSCRKNLAGVALVARSKKGALLMLGGGENWAKKIAQWRSFASSLKGERGALLGGKCQLGEEDSPGPSFLRPTCQRERYDIQVLAAQMRH